MKPARDPQFFCRLPHDRRAGRTHRGLSCLARMALAFALLAVPWLRAEDSKPTDYDVKAVYLYNFGRFVEWPASVTAKSESFNVCILGEDPFGPVLDATLVDETINGKRVAAKRISTPQEAVICQILFLSSGEDSQLSKIIAVLNKGAVLTVSDMPHFSQRGGMIQFVVEGKKIRFEVNLTAVQRGGLMLSSELLKVATTVRRSPSPGD